MIKFFREIRHKLLMENLPAGQADKTGRPASRTGRYFKYAIGEIILVVIGILIALQINNWNENRKLRALEIETLSEMKEGLIQDTIVINANLQIISDKINDADLLLGHVKANKPYMPLLDTIMMNVYYHKGYNTFNTAAFELLKERGFGIVQNKTLRKLITNHYTADISDIRSVLSRLDKINLIQGERMYENFLVENGIIKAYDYEQLLKNPKILGPFSHFQTMNTAYLDRLQNFNFKTKNVLNAVLVELESRN